MKRSKLGFLPLAAATLAAGLLGAPPGALAQESQLRESISIPGNEMMGLTVEAPERVDVGQQFQYTVHVSNLTDNIVLHDVKIKQHSSDKFNVENAQVMGRDGQQQGQQRRQQGQQQQQQQGQGQQNQQQGQQNQEQGQRGQQQGQNEWTISKLEPGETRSIQITAASDQEGRANTCLAIASYTPALCLVTEFVQPQLKIVKEGPDRVNLCENFEYRYTVTNTGTGRAEKFTVRDKLAEGLQLHESDQKELEFTVEGLDPGEARAFEASISPQRAGTFSSRAVVVREGKESRSQKVTTQVQQADLAVSIEGPSTQYVGRPVDYTVVVTNRGDAPAPGTELAFMFPETGFRVLRAGDPQRTQQQAQAGSGGGGGQQPTPADDPTAQQQGQQQGQQQQGQQNQRDMAASEWNLGNLDPGQSMRVNVTLRGTEGGAFENKAVVSYVCDADRDIKTTATAFQRTEILSLPALAIAVIDQQDPAPTGEELLYTIVVQNEGTAEDTNVEVSAELPQNLKFVEGSGPTDPKADGSTVNFGKLDKLGPGEKAIWRLKTEVQEAGQIVLGATLKSDGLSTPANAEEPTQLFAADGGQQGQSQQGRGRQQGQNRQGQNQQNQGGQNQQSQEGQSGQNQGQENQRGQNQGGGQQ